MYRLKVEGGRKMTKNTGLGKGLEALLSNNFVSQEEEIQKGEVIHNLKIIEVEPNKAQPRMNFDEEALEELAKSIKQYGVIQPIIVTKKGDFYQIVAGERRWRASKKAGLSEIPAVVREYTEQTNREISLIENIQRENLNPIEKAKAMKELLDRYSLTQQKLADTLGISRSGIANSVRVLNMDPRVIELASQGKLTEGHCKALLAIENGDKQYQAAVYMIESGDSVREAEKQMKIKKKKVESNSRYEPIYRNIEESFRNFFGTNVKIDAGQRTGKIIIHYTSNDDLARILDLVK